MAPIKLRPSLWVASICNMPAFNQLDPLPNCFSDDRNGPEATLWGQSIIHPMNILKSTTTKSGLLVFQTNERKQERKKEETTEGIQE